MIFSLLSQSGLCYTYICDVVSKMNKVSFEGVF